MGGLPTAAAEAGSGAVDVSAEGTLVWLRRPNGTWWPSIVISPLDVPDGCPPPPRCPAVPIMLLGRRDGGNTYVDWCNLERCQRVKPFRCGELDFDRRITSAQALAASRPICKGRYARREDAILQALEIERARALHAPNSPSPNKKRKTPNDSEDDAPPKGSRRMRDLSDIQPDLNAATTVSALTSHLPSVVNQAKRSKHAHASATTNKRKQATPDLLQPCANSNTSRKKDRSRPLSELCNGDAWNGFTSNGQTADVPPMSLGAASSSGSSGTSTLVATSSHKTCSPRSGAFKTDRPKPTQVSSMNGSLLGDDSSQLYYCVKPAPLDAAPSILEPDHGPASQPCASPKYLSWKHPKQTTDFSKAELSSHCEGDDFTIGSVHEEGSNRTRNARGHKHHKTKAVKQKAPRNEVDPLEKKEKAAKLPLNKPSESGDNNMHIAVFPSDSDCVGAVQQQHDERNRDLGESSGSISSSSNCENGSLSSLVFELPLQTLPPLKSAPDLEMCRDVKPIKTLQLNPVLYDVQLSARGISSTGRRVPLVSLMSKWNHKPVVGYPISVEVSDDVFGCRLLSDADDRRRPATGVADWVLEKGKADAWGARPKSRRKASGGKEVDNLWQPHTKKAAASSSPRKMRRLSSIASSQRDGDSRKSLVGKVSRPTVACIPLRVVFSRIKEALSHPVK